MRVEEMARTKCGPHMESTPPKRALFVYTPIREIPVPDDTTDFYAKSFG